MLDVGGQDSTEAFEDVGHSDEAREILNGLLVGSLKRQVRFTLYPSHSQFASSKPFDFASGGRIRKSKRHAALTHSTGRRPTSKVLPRGQHTRQRRQDRWFRYQRRSLRTGHCRCRIGVFRIPVLAAAAEPEIEASTSTSTSTSTSDLGLGSFDDILMSLVTRTD